MTTLPKEKESAKKIIYPLNVDKALIGLELSEADEPLLRYFHFIDQYLKTEKIFCVHVVNEASSVFPIQAIYPEKPVGLDEKLHGKLMKKMEAELRQVFSEEVMDHIHYSVELGNPADMINKLTKDADANLLVIGKAADKDAHTLQAMNLIRATTANVLVAPEKSLPALKTILVPIDFSQNAVRALKTAVGFKHASLEPVRVIGMHVQQKMNLWAYGIGMVPMKPDTDLKESHLNSFNHFLEANIPGLSDNVEPLLLENEVPEVATLIINQAHEVGADLIIMGAKGHSKLYQILLGSTTEMLLRSDDNTPVLVVK